VYYAVVKFEFNKLRYSLRSISKSSSAFVAKKPKFRKEEMKKIAFLIIAVLTALMFISCPGIGPDPNPATYTVTYDGNNSDGGAVPTDSEAYEEGATVTVVDSGTMTRSGYTFTGWNTALDGSETARAVGSTFSMGAEDVTLYAQWTQNATYTVTYNGNGSDDGTVPSDSNNYEQDAEVTVLGNTGNLVMDGYTFSGWNTQENGNGDDRAVGSTFNMGAEDVTLYAQWTVTTCTVTYDGNGSNEGTVPTDSSAYKEGDIVTVFGDTGSLVKMQDGISLLLTGWNTQTDGTGAHYDLETGTFTMETSDILLYAEWSVLRGTGPAGGLIFYDKGSYSDGWRYLEAAPVDQTASVWGTCPQLVSGADGTAIGTGNQNTLDIVVYDPLENTAADECYNYCIVNGIVTYEDWFLPSIDELYKMYVNLHQQGVGGFDDWVYWSSSEYNEALSWWVNFEHGFLAGNLKHHAINVRAARAF
jgi:uncharacterized repeat protein (TIGR02543 family)